MANPQKEDGHIRISNEVWDALVSIRIPGEARQVLDFVVRKTWGWGKKDEKISLLEFQNSTGIKKQAVIRALKRLKLMNLIDIQPGKRRNIYSFNKDYDTWNPLSKKIIANKRKSVLLPYCYICKFKDALHKHHIIPIRQGGQEKVSNKIILCPNCHALVHKGKYTAEFLVILKENAEKSNQKDNSDLPKSKQAFTKKIIQQGEKTNNIKDLQAPKTTSSKTTSLKDNNLCVREDFEKFYHAYPKKKNKPGAWKAWNQVFHKPKSEYYHGPVPLQNVMDSVESHKNTRQWIENNGQFIPGPAPWLRSHGFNDQVEPCNGQVTKTRQEIMKEAILYG